VFFSINRKPYSWGIFKEYLGPNLLGLLVTPLITTVLEVCSEGIALLALKYRTKPMLLAMFLYFNGGCNNRLYRNRNFNISKETAILFTH